METTNLAEKAAHGMTETAETIASTLVAVLNKLAGRKSDVKLSFEDLTLEFTLMKARLNGAIVLDVVFAAEAEAPAAPKRAQKK